MSDQEEEKSAKVYDAALVRRLMPFIKPYSKQVFIALATLLFAAAFEIVVPKLTQIAIDDYIRQNDLPGLRVIIAIFFAVLVLGFLTRLGEMFVMEWIGQHIMFDLRKKIFSHLQHLSLTFFNRNPVGKLMTRVTSDVQALNELFTSGMVAIFGDLLMLFGIIFIMFYMSWKLTLVTLVVLPLLFGITILFKIKVRDAFRAIRTRIAKINAYLQENITGMAVVQLFNREAKNFKEFDRLNRDHLDAYLKTIFYFAVFYPVVNILGALSTALVIWYGGLKIIAGELSFGALVAFIQYAIMFYRPISDLSEKFNILQAAMAASERIFGILDEKPEAGYGLADFDRHVHLQGEIEFSNVRFAYKDEEWVLKDVSFQIAPGEKIAIVGATGAGKTTIINLLGRFYNIQRGNILLDGRNIDGYDLQELRRNIGIVLQDVFMFAGTVADNIRLGNKQITGAQIRQAAKDVNALGFIEKLENGFDEKLIERGATLSVGQRQLLAFARALAFDPAILILDEATSNIDTETELLIQEAVARLMENRTSIIIAHRLSTIQHVDRIIALHRGEIREIGTHQELLAKGGIYSRLYELQFAGRRVEKAVA
jgi:ATP-binding cassette subfamily B protein